MFRRDGRHWTLAFGGRSVPLRDAKGLRDLAVLLAAPGREVAATELVAGVRSAAAAGLAALGADPVLDDRARAAYRSRLARLDEELAEADTHHDIERSARLAAERDALIDELTSAAGLGGRRSAAGRRHRASAHAPSRPGSAMPSAASSGSIPSSAGTCGPAS